MIYVHLLNARFELSSQILVYENTKARIFAQNLNTRPYTVVVCGYACPC